MKRLCLMALLMMSSNVLAEGMEVKVKGMVCSFCTNGVEKTFKAREEVKSIKVDMDEKLVSIDFKEKKTMSDDLVKKLITDAGFNVASVKRIK